MNIYKLISLALTALLLAACGSSSDFKGGGDGGGTDPTQALGSLVTTSSATSINSDGTDSVVITTTASDTTGAAMAGVAVSFASTGDLSTTSATTNSSGQASTTLTIAAGTAGPISVDASSGSNVAPSISVAVITIVPPSIQLITDPAQISSNGAQEATITAFVKDEANNFVEGATVSFSSDSGGIRVTQAVTDSSGVATASLSAAGDQTNRIIMVTGTVDGVQDSVDVAVIGSTLQLSGPISISSADVAEYTVVLSNSDGIGIAGEEITVTSANGNQLSLTTLTTDTLGRATFDLTGGIFGVDVISVSGFGLNDALELIVSGDEFIFTSPVEFSEIPLNTPQDVTVTLQRDGTPVMGELITFTTTRGIFVGGVNTALTDANGQATATIQSDNSGPVLVLGNTSDGVTTQYDLEFIATNPQFIEVQASPFTISTNEQSSIFAIVRDINNNLVKNATVVFSLTDVSGGTLSAGTAVTNSQGMAQIFYNSGNTPSGKDGVTISATVVGTTITDTVSMTVSGRAVFISMGTGNTVIDYTDPQYAIEYAIQVTDINGIGIAGAPLTIQMLPDLQAGKGYYKGYYWLNSNDDEDSVGFDLDWEIVYTTGIVTEVPVFGWTNRYNQSDVEACKNEDINSNGILDPGEDLNGNVELDPGNVATATPRNVTTDENGFAYVLVVYPKEFTKWVDVKLSVQTTVAGTEYTESRFFLLKGIAADYEDSDIEPPGQTSPYGDGGPANYLGVASCANTI